MIQNNVNSLRSFDSIFVAIKLSIWVYFIQTCSNISIDLKNVTFNKEFANQSEDE